MIKFKIYPKIWEEEMCKFGEALKKCQSYRFSDIFLDILHKMKKNLDQEHVKRGLPSFQGKIGTISSAIPGKMTVFPVLTLLFHPSFPKIWLSHLNKNYIFEISDNKTIR